MSDPLSTATGRLDLPSRRAAGSALILGSLAILAVMSHHPEVEASSQREFIENIGSIAELGRIVHTFALITMSVTLFGFWGLVDLLGRHRTDVRAGWIAFLAGSLGGGGAAVLNGFVAAGLAARYEGASEFQMESLAAVFRFAGELDKVLAQLAVVGWSIAAVLWAVALWRKRSQRWLAVLGLACGGTPLAALMIGHLPMNVAGFGAFAVAQALWGLALGTQLFRRKL